MTDRHRYRYKYRPRYRYPPYSALDRQGVSLPGPYDTATPMPTPMSTQTPTQTPTPTPTAESLAANQAPRDEKHVEAFDGFEDVDLGGADAEKRRRNNNNNRHRPPPPPPPPEKRGRHGEWSRQEGVERFLWSAARWWQDEFWMLAVCVGTATGLAALLRHYDSRVVPESLAGLGGLQLDTAVIALVTVVRVSLKAVVETALSQGAWLWVSERAQQRRWRRRQKSQKSRGCCGGGGAESGARSDGDDAAAARLSDFKVFDEASRGLWGSLCLIWRMKGCHLGCVGAAIIVLVHGFETFSQQMVTFEQRPAPVAANGSFTSVGGAGQVSVAAAAPPPRAEVWDTVLRRGYAGGTHTCPSKKPSQWRMINRS